MSSPSDPFRRRTRDTHVLFAIRYDDGRSAYIRVSQTKLEHGDGAARSIALQKQEAGEIPAGDITEIKRVK
jgi:hypothetical protein